MKYRTYPTILNFPRWFYRLPRRISDKKFEEAFTKALAETKRKLLKEQWSHFNNLHRAELIGAL